MCNLRRVKEISQQLGVKFIGVSKLRDKQLLQFDLPNKSTFSIRKDRFSVGYLKEKINHHIQKFEENPTL